MGLGNYLFSPVLWGDKFLFSGNKFPPLEREGNYLKHGLICLSPPRL